jgi:hypothetical protein
VTTVTVHPSVVADSSAAVDSSVTVEVSATRFHLAQATQTVLALVWQSAPLATVSVKVEVEWD